MSQKQLEGTFRLLVDEDELEEVLRFLNHGGYFHLSQERVPPYELEVGLFGVLVDGN